MLCLQWAVLTHYLTFKQSIWHIYKCCQHIFPTFPHLCYFFYFASSVIRQHHRIIAHETGTLKTNYVTSELLIPALNHPAQSMLFSQAYMSSNPSTVYLLLCPRLLARSWRHKHEAKLTEEEGSIFLLLTSLLNLPCSLPLTLTSSCWNTYTCCICFAVDLLPLDCNCSGLQHHCFYGIGCSRNENRYQQQCTLNKKKSTCRSILRKGHKHKSLG